jgi:hypothetical protein
VLKRLLRWIVRRELEEKSLELELEFENDKYAFLRGLRALVEQEVRKNMEDYYHYIDDDILSLIDIAEPTIEVKFTEEILETREPIPMKSEYVLGRIVKYPLRICKKKRAIDKKELN